MSKWENITWYMVFAYCITSMLALAVGASFTEEQPCLPEESPFKYECNIEQLPKGTAITCNNGHMYYLED